MVCGSAVGGRGVAVWLAGSGRRGEAELSAETVQLQLGKASELFSVVNTVNKAQCVVTKKYLL